MSVTPAGPISVAVAGVQTLLANCAYFQTWTSTDSVMAAAANIFVGEVGFPIASVSLAGDVITVQTREDHNLAVDQVVTLEGPSFGAQGLNLTGALTIAAITANGFTASLAAPDIAITYPAGGFVVPSSEPFACISHQPGSLKSQIVATSGACIFSGAIDIFFENTIDPDYANDPVNAQTQAETEFGQLIQAIAQTQGTGDYICLNDVETIAGAQFIAVAMHDDSTKRFERWTAMVRCTWGLKS